MARPAGSMKISANIEPNVSAPLDGRSKVATLADLTANNSFPYFYEGMQVYVVSEKKSYTLIGNDTTVIDNWEEVGSGSITIDDEINSTSKNPVQNKVIKEALDKKADLDVSGKIPSSQLPPYVDDVIEGYYHEDKFYEDDEYTTEIDGERGKIYVDIATNKSYRWSTVFIEIINGGSGSLSRAITAAIGVGGVEVGDTFAQGTSYDDMWDALLNPTLYPTFTAPSASLTYSANTNYAVGTVISSKNATVGYDAGAITLNGIKQNNRGGNANLYAISTSGADTEYSDSDASSGAFTVPSITRSTKGTIVITATVSYDAGPQPKDSKGGDYQTPLPSGNVTATKTLTFIQSFYYGISNTASVPSFSNLTENVTTKGTKTFNFTTNNQYMVFVYDSAYGNLTSILDSNGFETISGWTESTITVDGFSYNAYIANSPTTDTNAAFTFKF